MKNFQSFMQIYTAKLLANIQAKPEDYALNGCKPEDYARVVSARMGEALAKCSADWTTESFKHTCKELGIKHTRTAIYNYLIG